MFSPWTCGSCDFFLSSTVVEAKIDTIEDELSVITSKRDLRALEDFVQHYSGKILHPNHYLLLLAKRNYLFISRKNLINLMTKCTNEEQMELKAAFKNKNELYREFWWIPEKLCCSETFWCWNWWINTFDMDCQFSANLTNLLKPLKTSQNSSPLHKGTQAWNIVA